MLHILMFKKQNDHYSSWVHDFNQPWLILMCECELNWSILDYFYYLTMLITKDSIFFQSFILFVKVILTL